MNEFDYQRNVLARCSSEWHGSLIDLDVLQIMLARAIATGDKLDQVKKAIFYGKEPSCVALGAALRTTPMTPTPDWKTQRLIHAIIGAYTESVELLEILSQYLDTGKPMDEVHLQEEFGDLNWYRTLALNVLSQSDEQNRKQNDAKLEARFGAAFSKGKANFRDLDAERKTLEGE